MSLVLLSMYALKRVHPPRRDQYPKLVQYICFVITHPPKRVRLFTSLQPVRFFSIQNVLENYYRRNFKSPKRLKSLALICPL